jgi:predicted acylesterase/phospholipase RssA
MRRALVLSGGGAKGAYEFGCLKAFKEHNIEFDMVTGTSVGALNAICWSTNKLEDGEALWDTLSYGSTYPLLLLKNIKVPKLIIVVLSLLFVLRRMFVRMVNRSSIPSKPILILYSLIVSGFINAPLILLALFPKHEYIVEHRTIIYALIYVFVTFLFVLGTISLVRRWESGNSTVNFIYILNYFLFPFIVGNFLLMNQFDSVVLKFIMFFVGFIVFLFVLYWLDRFIRKLLSKMAGNMNRNIFDNSPLRQSVYNILNDAVLTCPTFITVAGERNIFNPNENTSYSNQTDPFTIKKDPILKNSDNVAMRSIIEVDGVKRVQFKKLDDMGYFVFDGKEFRKIEDFEMNEQVFLKSIVHRFESDLNNMRHSAPSLPTGRGLTNSEKRQIESLLSSYNYYVSKDYELWQPNYKKEWVPFYINLDLIQSITNRVNFTLASAAIPFGFVQAVTIENEEFVDGGISDNTPLLPVLSDPEPFDEIFVVVLSSFKNNNEAMNSHIFRVDHWQKLVQLVNLNALGVPNPQKVIKDISPKQQLHDKFNKNMEASNIKIDHALNKMPKIHLFYPKKKLGGWISGTLNFKTDYATRIKTQGYHETMDKLGALQLGKNNEIG